MFSSYAGKRRGVQCAIGWLLLALVLVALPALAQKTPDASPRTVLVMGDSLSAAYGMAPAQGWVALATDRMKTQKPGWRMVNASVSGETTAGGASRIAGELQRNKPSVVVIALGANDGLRGLPLAQSRANLEKMILASQQAGAQVLLIGMRMPPNLGPDYTRGFEENFIALSEQHHTALLPFLLEPIALDRDAFQPDNLHPTTQAQPKLRDHVWPVLLPLLK